MNLQEAYLSEASQQMSDQIDFEIISELLCDIGWIKIVLTPMTKEVGDEIDQWLVAKCRGEYRTMGLVFIFEDARDATWFTLKWS